VRRFQNGAVGFEQGTSKVENSSPWYKRADIQKVRRFQNGAVGFEQGTSKVENSSPWYKRADIQSKGIFLQ
jgi:hypothetical protein